MAVDIEACGIIMTRLGFRLTVDSLLCLPEDLELDDLLTGLQIV